MTTPHVVLPWLATLATSTAGNPAPLDPRDLAIPVVLALALHIAEVCRRIGAPAGLIDPVDPGAQALESDW